jgi:SAM-dependent methyltransferase
MVARLSVVPGAFPCAGRRAPPQVNKQQAAMKQLANDAPLPRADVIKAELAWHEEESHRRHTLDAFLYDPPAFDAVVKESIAFLAPQAGEVVLDLGCGEGKETLVLAQHGCGVVAVDLSPMQLNRARERVEQALPAAKVWYVQANAEELPFRAGAFRAIHAKAVLHHLDMDSGAAEIGRLLQPGGRAALAEPLRRHPLFRAARRLTPRLRTMDERPLEAEELVAFGRRFALSQTAWFFLLTLLAYPWRVLPRGEPLFRLVQRVLHQVDKLLLRFFPALGRYAWYGAVFVEK